MALHLDFPVVPVHDNDTTKKERMLNMRLKKSLAGLLAALMLLALLPAAALAAEAPVLTKGQVCDTLLAAADDYNPALKRSDILKGDANGDLGEDDPVTRAQALVMLSRAFGPLPAPVGDTARWAYPTQTFTDLPAWAETELANVFQSGIVAGTGETTFSPDGPITAEALDLLIRRVYAVEGSNLKDDFYATVNKDWLAASTIPDGQSMTGGMYTMMIDVQEDVAKLITDIAAGTHAKGTGEQKIADLYHNILDWDARNKAGIAPIKPYLDAVDQANTLEELMSLRNKIEDELYLSLLFGFALAQDLKDSTKYCIAFNTMSAGMSKDLYAADAGPQKDAYLKYLTTALTLGGVEAGEAARQAQAFYDAEKPLAAAMLNPEDRGNVDKIYNVYSMDDLKTLFPHVDLDAVFAASGLKSEARIGVSDVGLMEAFAPLMDEANLDTLKIVLRAGLLMNYGGLLSKEFTDAANIFQQEFSGVSGAMTDEALAAAQVQNQLSTYLEKAYVKEYFSPAAKADVEKMIQEMISVYKERIQGLDWMSDTTKKLALQKLDSLGVKVGYPDEWDDSLDKVEILSAADGGSFFQNILAINAARTAEYLAYQGTSVDKTKWICPAFTVNAFYNATANDITFPAAVLQAPMYDVTAPKAQNLGGIGYIIAHEITHAFDNNGAKFDDKGNAANWWTEEDYAAFTALCDQAVAYYDGAESIPGILCNGTQTLSENVADLGAAACITDIVSREETPDYATLYKTMAETWASTSSRAYSEYLNQLDVHAANKLRGYMPAQTCDEFYTTFDIQPGDGMWVAPEDRVRIW